MSLILYKIQDKSREILLGKCNSYRWESGIVLFLFHSHFYILKWGLWGQFFLALLTWKSGEKLQDLWPIHTLFTLFKGRLNYSQKRFDKKILDLFLFLLFLIQLLSARSLNKDWHAQLTPRHSYTRPFKYPNPHSAGRGPYILAP